MSVPTPRGWAARDPPPLNLPSLLPAGRLQGSGGLLPVLYHGQLLLAAGGGSLPTHPAGRLLLLRTEVLLGVHTHRLGYGTREGAGKAHWVVGGCGPSLLMRCSTNSDGCPQNV